MAKRKCGTCRHFKDGGIASSGWCQHPARRDLQHMVLVRKTELACRNTWDQDLWETADGHVPHDGPQPFVPTPLLASGPSDTITPSRPLMSADEAADRLRTGDLYTDKVTSISMPLRPAATRLERQTVDEQFIPTSEHEDSNISGRSGLDISDARSVVREARRRQQEQRKADQRLHQERIIREAGTLLDQGHSLSDDLQPESSPPATVDPQVVPYVDAPVTLSHRPAGHVDFLEARVPRQTGSRRIDETGQGGEVRFSRSADRFNSGPPRRPTDMEPAKRTHDRPTPRGKDAPVGESPDGGTEPLPIAELNAMLRPAAPDEPDARRHGRRPSQSRPGPVTGGDQTVSDMTMVDPPLSVRPSRWITGAGSIPLTQTRVGAPAVAPDLPFPLPVDPIDRDNDLRTVPRCCGTCRDFKRLNDTGQGWCTNTHAFAERRMVESDGLACRSSSGLWWLPHDDLWLERADTTHHGRPTPMLDGLAREVYVGKQEMDPRSS